MHIVNVGPKQTMQIHAESSCRAARRDVVGILDRLTFHENNALLTINNILESLHSY